MKINQSVFEKVSQHDAKVLCVTKYWDTETTKTILDFGETHYSEYFLGIGENRIQQIHEKQLSRDTVHFVGNLQSRNLKELVRNVSVIHSLHKFSHLQKLEALCDEYRFPISIFLQVNISQEPQKGGILPEELPSFLQALPAVVEDSMITVAGISAIGAGEFTIAEKVEEFKRLRALRDNYFPEGKISAGTSRDYEIALEEGIDIVRVGKALIEEED